MVDELGHEMVKHRIHEGILKDQLLKSEDIAIGKALQLENLKDDVHRLKLTL